VKRARFGHLALVMPFRVVSRSADVAGSWGEVLGRCSNRRLWVYTPCLVAQVEFMKRACFGHLALVMPFRVVSRSADVAGSWGEVPGCCRRLRSQVYMPWLGCERKNAQNVHCRRFAVPWVCRWRRGAGGIAWTYGKVVQLPVQSLLCPSDHRACKWSFWGVDAFSEFCSILGVVPRKVRVGEVA